jgi:DNA processing protein
MHKHSGNAILTDEAGRRDQASIGFSRAEVQEDQMSQPMSTIEDRRTAFAYCAIEAAVGFSKKIYFDLLSRASSPVELWESIYTSKKLQTELGTDQQTVGEVVDRLERSFDEIERNTFIVPISSGHYPDQLKLISNAPTVLFVKGNLSALKLRGVSVVGSRSATNEGLQRAAVAARLLRSAGYAVVSGLARGIDTAGHLSAIQSGAHTTAVIGTPIDRFYPAENQGLQETIAERGTLVSQFSPIHPITRFNFPLRNATMSGLTLATVIVEAGETSGSLTQAKYCMSQKRKLFIMQNQIDKKNLAWPKKFLERGGIPLREIGDLVRELSEMALVAEKSREGVQRTLI